jgi:DNA-3-methyladenine glycosylase II
MMPFTETFTIKPVPPFSLDLTAQIFGSGDTHVRSYIGGVFQQVFQVNENHVLAKLTNKGTTEQPLLTIELHSNRPIASTDKQEALQAIKRIFSLDLDLNIFYKDVENDHVMRQITPQLYGYRFTTTLTVFESLVDAIAEQQISIKVARIIEERLAVKFGEKLEIEKETFFAFPTPNNLAEACISDIQGVGLSKRKAEYIYNAAKMIVDSKLDLQQMKKEADAKQVIAELDALKGVGVWTAELTMLRGMHRWDVLPADDFGIRRAISAYYCSGSPIKTAEAREIAKAWGKWRGLAAFYLIVAEVKGIAV